jgi:hypothetical protein
MLDLKLIEIKISEKKTTLAELVKKYNEVQGIGNQLSIEIIKIQGAIDSFEELKKEIVVPEAKK